MPSPLTRSDLLSLEEYDARRNEFRANILAHKKNRQIQLGENARLLFEDGNTMQYQIQEMLRAEKIFKSDEIEEELATYNPLIPDGDNWKATFMIEYPDVAERHLKLAGLVGVEHRVWAQIEGFDKVFAIADEDLDRSTEEKTASVHFLRFQLTPEMVAAAKSGKAIALGIAHRNMNVELNPIPDNFRASLVKDLV